MGQGSCKKFIAEGYSVVGTVTHNDPATPDKFRKVVVDVMNEDDAQKFVDSVVAEYGKIDAAILTVGGFGNG